MGFTCHEQKEDLPPLPPILLSADVGTVNNSQYDTAFRQNQGSQVRDVTGLSLHVSGKLGNAGELRDVLMLMKALFSYALLYFCHSGSESY
jgi:hypothetical protein